MQSLSENCVLTFFLIFNFLVLVNTFLLRSDASTEMFVSFWSFYIEENKGELVYSKFDNFSPEELQFY